MASPVGEDNLEDVPIDDFKGVTLRLDPASGQPSRSVSPSGPDVPSSGSTSHRWLSDDSSLRLIVLLNDLSECLSVWLVYLSKRLSVGMGYQIGNSAVWEGYLREGPPVWIAYLRAYQFEWVMWVRISRYEWVHWVRAYQYEWVMSEGLHIWLGYVDEDLSVWMGYRREGLSLWMGYVSEGLPRGDICANRHDSYSRLRFICTIILFIGDVLVWRIYFMFGCGLCVILVPISCLDVGFIPFRWIFISEGLVNKWK